MLCCLPLQDPELFELVASATSSTLPELSPHSLSDLITAFAKARDPQATKVCEGRMMSRRRPCGLETCVQPMCACNKHQKVLVVSREQCIIDICQHAVVLLMLPSCVWCVFISGVGGCCPGCGCLPGSLQCVDAGRPAVLLC